MILTINGRRTEFGVDPFSVEKLLAELEVEAPHSLSISLNGKIIYRDDFEHTTLKDGDEVEVLYFMAGG